MGFYFAQALTGLASASSLFLVAAGLSLIFGVTRIVNFAHGTLYMLGAYVALDIIGLFGKEVGFWLALPLTALIIAAVGGLIEFTALRRVYRAPEMFQLVATFAIVLILQDVALAIWGSADRFGPRAPGLDSVVRIFGEPVPEYDLFLIAMGPLALGVLWLVFERTRFGVLVRAATQDREMAAALGVNQARLFTAVFCLGSGLAGLGGALQIPRESVAQGMDLAIIAEVFVVTVVGGMGSILGAYLAAVLIAMLNAFGILILPEITLIVAFAAMAVVLVIRPYGLLGRPPSAPESHPPPDVRMGALSGRGWLVVLAGFAVLPLFVGDFLVVLATDIVVLGVFAASLQFLMGPGGMVSFGHAAYFGAGAYGAALLSHHFGVGMIGGLAAAPVAAGVAALLFGWFCVRLTGVYLAMLTLAAAQIVWAAAVQMQEYTGGDDGLTGIWPASWASSNDAYYYLALAGGVIVVAILRRAASAPFGMALRAGRDAPLRAEAIGVDVRRQKWFAFTLAGMLAGLAGGMFVYQKGSVFPDAAAIPQSIDALVVVLLGGVDHLVGALIGAGTFRYLEDSLNQFQFWRAFLGGLILLIAIAAPGGMTGLYPQLTGLAGRLRRRPAA
ncbi:MAG: ABC transporter permease [Rhizobiales bacterium NRL2]|jgi:branched-chain amino acid transport system permease protein|nr:MAG: ABC transporter permease [Rhizobiales bacterium NRL2]